MTGSQDTSSAEEQCHQQIFCYIFK